MGHSFEATCLDCRERFQASEGGGFAFHLLRCDRCGQTKDIGFDEIGEPHLRYLKGLDGPYCVASSASDEAVRRDFPGEPMTEDKYHRAVETLVGSCECGGQFRFDAPIRCPRCRSTNIEQGEIDVMYD